MTNRLLVGMASVALLVVLVSCSDDDGPSDGESPEASASLSAAELRDYCGKVLKVETAPFPQAGEQSEAQRAETFKGYAARLRTLVEDAADAAPAKTEIDLRAIAKGWADVVDAGGDLNKRGTPAVRAATVRAHAFDLASCGWRRVDTAAVEFAFQGLPPTVPAGVVSFELANQGTFDHVLELYRVNGEVSAPALELLSGGVPSKEDLAKLTDLGAAFAREGETGYLVRDLEPGRYIAACLISLGGTPPATHASKGMLADFTVTSPG